MTGAFTRTNRNSGGTGCPADEGEGAPDEYVFGLFPGVPAFAGSLDRLVALVARAGAEAASTILFPDTCHTDVTKGDSGYYYRVLVPVPNGLPPVLAARIVCRSPRLMAAVSFAKPGLAGYSASP